MADGHHRYETAVNYREEMRAAGAGEGPHDYVMMHLVDFDGGLSILPTHRMLSDMNDLNTGEFLSGLDTDFDVEKIGPADRDTGALFERMGDGPGKKIGMCLTGQGQFLLTLKANASNDTQEAREFCDGWPNLDVNILQYLIFNKRLNITKADVEAQCYVSYTRDVAGGVSKVASGRAQALFLLNPTLAEEVREIANAGDRMPQKSTYFYPKLLTGLVFNSLDS
ncbi:DUF1015 family protein [Candidatus Hydrogenedentota bacterium]